MRQFAESLNDFESAKQICTDSTELKVIETSIQISQEKLPTQHVVDRKPEVKEHLPSVNVQLQCASNSIRAKYQPGPIGRYIVATHEIKAGEILVQEEPYAACLLREHELVRCHHCFKQKVTLKP